jgi:hypothetical protein
LVYRFKTKAMTITINAKVTESGEMQFENQEDLNAFLAAQGFRTVEVTIRPLEPAKSHKQLRYYWGTIIPTIQTFYLELDGEVLTPTEVHFRNKITFGLKPKSETVLGREVFVFDTVSVAQMSIKDFAYFIETIVKYYAERGVEFPEKKA